MEKRPVEELRIYKNADLMEEFNNMSIRIKTHLYDLGDYEFKNRHPKPTIEELTNLFIRVQHALKADSELMVKRKSDQDLTERDGPNYEADIDTEE